MRTTLLLRIASVLSLLFGVGHTLGGLSSWSPPGESEVLNAMRAFRFDVAGVSRTYLDFYLGFGYTLSAFMFLQAVLLWQLASIAKTQSVLVRPLIASFVVASLVCCLLSLRFIFPIPVVLGGMLTVCLGLAFFKAR